MAEYVTVWRDHEPTKLRWGIPVVRCRDCRYYEPNTYSRFTCELLTFHVNQNDFCSQGERKEGGRMSITNELREYVQGWRETPNLMDELDAGDIDGLLGDFEHIADRIDSEYEAKVSYWQGANYRDGYDEGFASADDWLGQHEDAMAEHGWIRLPEDADGEYIHIGDALTDDAEFKSEGKVMRLMLEDEGWMVGLGCGGWTEPSIHEWHHHEPTVEDLIRDVILCCVGHSPEYWNEPIAECAAKLRLAGEDA